MSQPCRLISWSMAFHSSGPTELNSSPTAENKLPFTALATCRETTVQLLLHTALFLSSVTSKPSAVPPRSATERHTHPVEAGLSAELVGPRRAEVIVRPEGLVERRDEVEKSLPATLVTQRVLPVFAAFSQPGGQNTERDIKKKEEEEEENASLSLLF